MDPDGTAVPDSDAGGGEPSAASLALDNTHAANDRRNHFRSFSLASATSLGSALGSLLGPDFQVEVTVQPGDDASDGDDGDGEVLLHWVDGHRRQLDAQSASAAAAAASSGLQLSDSAVPTSDRPDRILQDILSRALGVMDTAVRPLLYCDSVLYCATVGRAPSLLPDPPCRPPLPPPALTLVPTYRLRFCRRALTTTPPPLPLPRMTRACAPSRTPPRRTSPSPSATPSPAARRRCSRSSPRL